MSVVNYTLMGRYSCKRCQAGGSFFLQARTTLGLFWACFFQAVSQLEGQVMNYRCLCLILVGCLRAVPASRANTLISFGLEDSRVLCGVGTRDKWVFAAGVDFCSFVLVLEWAAWGCRLHCSSSLEGTFTFSCWCSPVLICCVVIHCSNGKLNMKRAWRRKTSLWWVAPSECVSVGLYKVWNNYLCKKHRTGVRENW